jgi:hypothetical protein
MVEVQEEKELVSPKDHVPTSFRISTASLEGAETLGRGLQAVSIAIEARIVALKRMSNLTVIIKQRSVY